MSPINNEKPRFVENLANINRDVKVNEDIIELITAYTSLRLDREKEVIFYDDSNPSTEVFLHRKAKFDKDLEVFFKKNQHIDRKTLDFLSRYAEELNLRGAKFLISPAHLASILDLQENKLNWMASPNEKHYKSYVIKKRDGAKRFIFEPKPYLKETQRKILKQLLMWIRPEPQAEGFRKRRSILTNSKRHVGSNILIKIDLKDFFPTITYQRVFGLFKSLGYTDTVSVCLAHLVTYNGRLPIGAPTSPALSNLICRRLDFRFSKLGEKMNFNYSRYADDIAISSERRDLNRYIPFFTSIITDEGFDINQKKLRVFRKNERQKLTGIIVNKKPNIDRREIKKIRAVIYNCKRGTLLPQKKLWAKKIMKDKDITMDKFKASLYGKINFVAMVNPKVGKKLKESFKEIQWGV